MAIDPHFHVHFHANQSCNQWFCCFDFSENVSEEARMVPVKGNTLAPEQVRREGCWSAFRRVFCGCCGVGQQVRDPEEENEQAAEICDQYLEQKYGSLTARVAPKVAGIDLHEKRERREPLLVQEARAIVEQADLVKQHEEELDQMMAQLKLFCVAQEIRSTPQRLSASPSSPSAQRSLSPRSVEKQVVKADGKVEPFHRQKVKRTITRVPVQDPVPDRVMDQVVERVQEAIFSQEGGEIAGARIRELIVGELLNAGIAITAPVFMQHLPQHVRENLEQKKVDEALSREEYQALLATAVHHSSSKSLQKMKVDIDGID